MEIKAQHYKGNKAQLKVKGRDFKVSALLFKITRKLEWSKLFFSSLHQRSIFCCPLCGGIRPDEYNRYSLHKDKRYLCGHFQECLYILISKENPQDCILP